MFAKMTYEQVLQQIYLLSAEDQARLLEELTALVGPHIENRPFHSILEAKGLGKEIWQGIDVEKFINEERNSWDEVLVLDDLKTQLSSDESEKGLSKE